MTKNKQKQAKQANACFNVPSCWKSTNKKQAIACMAFLARFAQKQAIGCFHFFGKQANGCFGFV